MLKMSPHSLMINDKLARIKTKNIKLTRLKEVRFNKNKRIIQFLEIKIKPVQKKLRKKYKMSTLAQYKQLIPFPAQNKIVVKKRQARLMRTNKSKNQFKVMRELQQFQKKIIKLCKNRIKSAMNIKIKNSKQSQKLSQQRNANFKQKNKLG